MLRVTSVMGRRSNFLDADVYSYRIWRPRLFKAHGLLQMWCRNGVQVVSIWLSSSQVAGVALSVLGPASPDSSFLNGLSFGCARPALLRAVEPRLPPARRARLFGDSVFFFGLCLFGLCLGLRGLRGSLPSSVMKV